MARLGQELPLSRGGVGGPGGLEEAVRGSRQVGGDEDLEGAGTALPGGCHSPSGELESGHGTWPDETGPQLEQDLQRGWVKGRSPDGEQL